MSVAPGSERVSPTRPGVKLTYDDFLLFPDDGLRHELIDGEHYVTPSPNMHHQRVLGRLYLALGNFLEAHPLGDVFVAPFDVVFSRFDGSAFIGSSVGDSLIQSSCPPTTITL